jgi:DNA end-binding protein Ku
MAKAMRAMWSGSVSFGLVNIPVKLYKAVDDLTASPFCNVHRECGTPVKQNKFCPKCNTAGLSGDDLQTAFPLDAKKTQVIPLSEEELASVPIPSAGSIAIEGFIKELPDIRYGDSFFVLAPEEKVRKPFALFTKVMQDLGVIGVARITMSHHEHICAIRPTGDGLMYVQTLHWADEIRNYTELRFESPVLSERELAMGKMLLESMAKPIDLAEFTDGYRIALDQLIEAKKQGITITVAPIAHATPELDLVDALMASLKAAETTKV